LDTVLKDIGIKGFDTEQILLTIPYDINEEATGETVTLLIDNRRFHLRIPEMEIVRNKQQKIDWDNTHAHRWSLSQWGKFIEKKFWDAYGFQSLELDLRGTQGAIRRGKVFGQIKAMINKIKVLLGEEFSDEKVVEYIVWAFSKKASKIALSMGLLACDGYIQDWVIWRKNDRRDTLNVSDKWKK
jgi:hypothetical protein